MFALNILTGYTTRYLVRLLLLMNTTIAKVGVVWVLFLLHQQERE